MPTKDLCPNEVTYTDLNGVTKTYRISAPIWDSRSLYGVLKDAFKEDYVTKKSVTIPAIKRIVYHDPATIVFWQDGTKTVVKCMDGEPFEKYAGFCAALAKKVFGSTSKAKKVAGAKKKGEVEE